MEEELKQPPIRNILQVGDAKQQDRQSPADYAKSPESTMDRYFMETAGDFALRSLLAQQFMAAGNTMVNNGVDNPIYDLEPLPDGAVELHEESFTERCAIESGLQQVKNLKGVITKDWEVELTPFQVATFKVCLVYPLLVAYPELKKLEKQQVAFLLIASTVIFYIYLVLYSDSSPSNPTSKFRVSLNYGAACLNHVFTVSDVVNSVRFAKSIKSATNKRNQLPESGEMRPLTKGLIRQFATAIARDLYSCCKTFRLKAALTTRLERDPLASSFEPGWRSFAFYAFEECSFMRLYYPNLLLGIKRTKS